MSFQLSHDFRTINAKGRLEDLQPTTSEEWIVWWYGGIERSNTAGNQPKVKVAFRKHKDGRLFDVFHRSVGISYLGLLRIGSLLKHGIPRKELVFERQGFALDFSRGNWRTISFEKTAAEAGSPPFPQSIHPLKYSRDKNQLLEFSLPSGGRLVVPCVEFFSRCYGRSQELKKALASYAWEAGPNCLSQRLYRPLGEPEESGKWKVSRGPRLSRADSVFLAHAKYDPYTRWAAKTINAQIESAFVSEAREPIFIKAVPWFQGPASILVEGIPFNSGESFLGLRILGCSDPAGIEIVSFQTSSEHDEIGPGQDQGQAWSGFQKRKLRKPPEVVDLTDENDPDFDAASVILLDPDFTVLGEQRLVTFPRTQSLGTSANRKSKKSEASLFSSGDPHGSGKDPVGYASIGALQEVESDGALQEVWNALVALRAEHPQAITSLSCFSPTRGFQEDAEPTLVSLSPFQTHDNVRGGVRSWPFLDLASRTKCRGLLVARLDFRGTKVYLIEIQRRDPQGGKEEPLRGYAFRLDNEDEFNCWLTRFRSAVREVKGIVQYLVSACPGTAVTFYHRKKQDMGTSIYTQAVRKALRRLSISVSPNAEQTS